MKQHTPIKRSGTVLAVALMLCSILIVLYPLISNYVFENRADSIISTYQKDTNEIEVENRNILLQTAQEYNNALSSYHVTLNDPFENPTSVLSAWNYEELLNTNENGILSYIEIPKINCFLPIYHGTSIETLEKGVGHVEGSSLPIGGTGTHCVLSGHTGLNRAKLFTDLNELAQTDHFFLHTLGETLAYEVDQILVVEPSDISALQIEQGKDYVTLVTCTPYGVNSHRLLVRGTRIDYTPEVEQKVELEQQSDTSSQWMQEYQRATLVGVGLVGAVMITVLFYQQKGRKKHG